MAEKPEKKQAPTVEPEGDSLDDLGHVFAILVEAGMPDAEIATIIGEMLISQSVPPRKNRVVQ